MKYLKSFGLYESVKQLTRDQTDWLDDHMETRNSGWELNPETGLVDVYGDVLIRKEFLIKLPVAFGLITGNFDCGHNRLISLEGAPQKVLGNFSCEYNKLKNLVGAPNEVGGNFECYESGLKSLKGGPRIVEGNFNCFSNKLTSLKGAPEIVGGGFNCLSCYIVSLEGAPPEVKNFDCSFNFLKNLKGAPRKVKGSFDCTNNGIISLDGAPEEISGHFEMDTRGEGRIKIPWNSQGWIKGLEKNPSLFFTFIINRLPLKDFSPALLAKIRKDAPDEFEILSKRLGDGASTAADLGEFGF